MVTSHRATFRNLLEENPHPRRPRDGSFQIRAKLPSRLFSRPDWLPLGLRGFSIPGLGTITQRTFLPLNCFKFITTETTVSKNIAIHEPSYRNIAVYEQSEQDWSFFLIGISMYVKKIRLLNLKLIKLINYVLVKNGIFHAYWSQTFLKAILQTASLCQSP